MRNCPAASAKLPAVQAELGRQRNNQNSSQPNPGSRPDGPPCSFEEGTENSALDPLATAMDYIYCIALGGPSIAIERGSIYHANFFMNDVFSSSPFSSKAEEQRKGERERERERVLTGRNGGMVDGHEAIEV